MNPESPETLAFKASLKEKKPLTQAQQSKCKEAKVCSYAAYLRLWNWHHFEAHEAQREQAKRNGVPSTHYIGTLRTANHKSRFFYSNWLQTQVFWYFAWLLEKSDVKTPFDKGRQIKTKQGKVIYVKSKFSKAGTADLVIDFPLLNMEGTKIINLEIKALKDVMSEEQKKERDRVRAKGQIYEIIRDMDMFWSFIDTLPIVNINGINMFDPTKPLNFYTNPATLKEYLAVDIDKQVLRMKPVKELPKPEPPHENQKINSNNQFELF